MKLHQLPKDQGALQRRKRVGCGTGSGLGKTCGRGHKGQLARSGGSVRVGFEGGQMPLFRKLPQRGFNNKRFRVNYRVVNVGDLDKVEGAEVDAEVLLKAGLINSGNEPLKVLGHGELTKALTIKADKFSASARSKIEAAGGKVVEPEAPATESSDS